MTSSPTSGWPPPAVPPPPPSPSASPAHDDSPSGSPWPLRTVWGPVGVIVAALVVLVIVALITIPLLDDRLAGAIAEAASATVILLGAVALWRGLPSEERARAIATRASWKRLIGVGVPLGLALVATQLVVIGVGAAIDPGVQRALEDPDNAIDLDLPHVALVLTLIALVVLAPVGEEMLFRVVMFRGLWTRMRFPFAAALSSLTFGLAHLDPWFTGLWPRSVALTLVGAGLCLVYRRWGYRMAVVAHGTVNTIAAVALLAQT